MSTRRTKSKPARKLEGNAAVRPPRAPQTIATTNRDSTAARFGPLPLRFGIVFISLILLASALARIDAIFFAGAADATLCAWAARILVTVASPFMPGIASHDAVVTFRSSVFQIIAECTGIEVIVLFVAATLAFPSRWPVKLWGLAVGIPLLLLVNLVRMMTVIYAATIRPALFEIAHLYVWPIVVLTCALALWLRWATKVNGEAHLWH